MIADRSYPAIEERDQDGFLESPDTVRMARQSPPCCGTHGHEEALQPGTEPWYRVIESNDPEIKRAGCSKIDIINSNEDGTHEICAALTDGPCCSLDERGSELHVDRGELSPAKLPQYHSSTTHQASAASMSVASSTDRTDERRSRLSDGRRPRR